MPRKKTFSVTEPKPGFFYVHTFENGKRIYLAPDPNKPEAKRFKTKAKAEAFAKKLSRKADASTFRELSPSQRQEYWKLVAQAEAHDMTLQEAVDRGCGRSGNWPAKVHDYIEPFLNYCRDKRQLDPSTVDFYKHKLRVLFRDYPNATFGDFAAHRIKKAIEEHKNSPEWEKGALRAVSAFFNWGFKQHPPVAPYGITKGVALEHPVKTREIEFLTVAEAARFMQEASTRWSRSAFALMLFIGMRKKTAEQMRWEWIDFDRRTIHIPAHISKVRAQLIETAPEVLWKWLRPEDAAKAFEIDRKKNRLPEGSPPSAPICRAQLRDQVKACAAASQIPQWRSSTLRHTMITYHYAAFKDAEATRAISGHDEDARTLEERYRGISTPRGELTYLASQDRARRFLSLSPLLVSSIATATSPEVRSL